MKKKFLLASLITTSSFFLTNCAYVQSPANLVEQETSLAEQKQLQQSFNQAQTPTLKRKIAIGRISNESLYGKSLLGTDKDHSLGKQLTDMLSKALVQSEHFIVLERPDLGALIAENNFAGSSMNKVGANVLLMGSLTEFGRKVDGKSGFLTNTKRQLAFATIDVRLVDVESGHVIFATSGTGEAVNESGSVFGWGDNRVAYDGTLSDKAIENAVSEVVSAIVSDLEDTPWETYFLSTKDTQIVISGGKHQGIKVGDTFIVEKKGEQIKSPQSGFMITLPGERVAEIEVVSLFGNNEIDEGSVCKIISGSINGYNIDELIIKEATD